MVIAGTPHIRVVQRLGRPERFGHGGIFQAVLERRLDAAIREAAGAQRPLAGSLQPVRAVEFARAEDPEAGAVAPGRVRPGRTDLPEQLFGVRADAAGLLEHPLGILFRKGAVSRRHVLRQRGEPVLPPVAEMTRDALSPVEHLQQGGGEADLNLLAHQRRRDAVVVILDLDVIVEVDPGLSQRANS